MARVVLIICVLALTGCDDYPKDARDTLKSVQNNQNLRVGLIEQKPWVYKNGADAAGIEVRIAGEFARSLNAEPKWTFLSESQATEKLKNFEIDLVVGGLTEDSHRKNEIGFTRPYLITGDDKKGSACNGGAPGRKSVHYRVGKVLKRLSAQNQENTSGATR